MLAVALLMVPVSALWLTRFLLFRQVGLIDSLGVLIAPAVMGTSPLFVLLFYWAFRRLPAELFETARIEGASAIHGLAQGGDAPGGAHHPWPSPS